MSEIKVNKISPRNCGTVTLGDSGDTITIPAGATIRNFWYCNQVLVEQVQLIGIQSIKTTDFYSTIW